MIVITTSEGQFSYYLGATGHAKDRLACAAVSGVITTLKAALDNASQEEEWHVCRRPSTEVKIAYLSDGRAWMYWKGGIAATTLFHATLLGLEALEKAYPESLHIERLVDTPEELEEEGLLRNIEPHRYFAVDTNPDLSVHDLAKEDQES